MPAELLTDELRQRVEEARRLLVDSEHHRGSTDLQLFVEAIDLTVQLHGIFLDADGQRRPELGAAEKRQGMAVVAHLALRTLPASFNTWLLTRECFDAVFDACQEAAGSEVAWHALLGASALASLFALFAACHEGAQAAQALFVNLSQARALVAEWGAVQAPVAALLEQRQASDGCSPALRAADARRLWLHLQHDAAYTLLCRAHGEAEPQRRAWAAAAVAANSALAAAEPAAAPFLLMRLGDILAAVRPDGGGAEAAEAYRSALTAARQHKAHLLEVAASIALAGALVEGGGGASWSLREVRALLDGCGVAVQRCGWLPGDNQAALAEALASHRAWVDAAAAEQPGKDMLPAAVAGQGAKGQAEQSAQPQPPGEGAAEQPRCAACGKACDGKAARRCRRAPGCCAVYCCHKHQQRHWKQGGHQQQCPLAPPAPARSGGRLPLTRLAAAAAVLLAVCLVALGLLYWVSDTAEL